MVFEFRTALLFPALWTIGRARHEAGLVADALVRSEIAGRERSRGLPPGPSLGLSQLWDLDLPLSGPLFSH